MEIRRRVLVLTTDPGVLDLVNRCLPLSRFLIRAVGKKGDILTAAAEWNPELVISECELHGEPMLELLGDVHQAHPTARFIVLTQPGQTLEVMRSLRNRIAAFLAKPFKGDDLQYYVDGIFRSQATSQNRREHSRYMLSVETHAIVINPFDNSEGRPLVALMRDVSRSGASMIVRQLVPVPAMLRLVVQFSDQTHPTILLAKSISCMLTQIPGVFRVGAKFVGLLPRDLAEQLSSMQAGEQTPLSDDIFMGKSFRDAVHEWLSQHQETLPADTRHEALSSLAAELARAELEHDEKIQTGFGPLPAQPVDVMPPGAKMANGNGNGNGHADNGRRL